MKPEKQDRHNSIELGQKKKAKINLHLAPKAQYRRHLVFLKSVLLSFLNTKFLWLTALFWLPVDFIKQPYGPKMVTLRGSTTFNLSEKRNDVRGVTKPAHLKPKAEVPDRQLLFGVNCCLSLFQHKMTQATGAIGCESKQCNPKVNGRQRS